MEHTDPLSTLTEAQQEWVNDLFNMPLNAQHPLAYCAPEIIFERAAQLAREAVPDDQGPATEDEP